MHGVFVGDWLFVFPLCGFSLSLFCNYTVGGRLVLCKGEQEDLGMGIDREGAGRQLVAPWNNSERWSECSIALPKARRHHIHGNTGYTDFFGRCTTSWKTGLDSVHASLQTEHADTPHADNPTC